MGLGFKEGAILSLVFLVLAYLNSPEDLTLREDTVAYNLPVVPAPVLTGTPLKIFATLLETWPISKLLLTKIRADSDMMLIRRFASSLPLDLTPTWDSFVQPTPSQVQTGEDFGLANLSAISSFFGETLQNWNPPQRGRRGGHKEGGFKFTSVEDYHTAYQRGDATPMDVAAAFMQFLKESEEMSPPMKFFSYPPPQDLVLKQALASVKRWEQKAPLSLLDGVIVVLKCDFDVQGFMTSGGSPLLAHVAQEDSYIAAQLKAAGAIVIGGANMQELGGGATGLNVWYGTPRNPYNTEHFAGGSSSGPGSLVGSGMAPAAIGSDGGGSVRIPASLCGLWGLKTTSGRVDGTGEVPICPTNGVAGPLTAHPLDNALVYSVISQRSPAVTASRFLTPHPVLSSLSSPLSASLKGLRVGVFWPWFLDCEEGVKEQALKGLAWLKEGGVEVVNVTVPHLRVFSNSHVVSFVTEGYSNTEKYIKENRDKVGAEYRILNAIASDATAGEILAISRVRTIAIQTFKEVFEQVDILVTPSTASAAPYLPPAALEAGMSDIQLNTKLIRYSSFANFAGFPAISVPIGYSEGLPVGLQLMADFWEEDMLYRAAGALSQKIETQKPQVHFDVLEKAKELALARCMQEGRC